VFRIWDFVFGISDLAMRNVACSSEPAVDPAGIIVKVSLKAPTNAIRLQTCPRKTTWDPGETHHET
jgi:hypothetical protein